MAIVAEGQRGRIYLPPTEQHETIEGKIEPAWRPAVTISGTTQYLGCKPYGMTRFSDLFTVRQLVALTTLTDLLADVRRNVSRDAITSDRPDDRRGLDAGGVGAGAYGEAVSVYLAFVTSSLADRMSTLCTWDAGGPTWGTKTRSTFARQAIPMSWDFAEVNPFSSQSGSFGNSLDYTAKGITATSGPPGASSQDNATSQEVSRMKVISTDPPYYDNVPYADISDFFYVWLRRALGSVFPGLLSTIAVPKAEELVAFAYRHDGKEGAEIFFLDGMTRAMRGLAQQSHPGAPITIYYAFKQSETEAQAGTISTGWVTFLDAVLRSGLSLTGTWPMRTELANRMRSMESNALASSIILVCRPRTASAPTTSRRAFLRELNAVLPEALDEMTKGSGNDRSPVAPVDLSQAIIGPGMAVFSKYAAVLEADGKPMSVRTALQLINRFLAEDDFDADTQFCLHWFEQHGWKDGKFGEADTLARAKGTSVEGVKQAGVLYAAGGVVRLLKWADYPDDWDPERDPRLPVWEVLHQLIRIYKNDGETGTGAVLAAVQAKAEPTRQLAYRLYTLCERAGWAEDARAYNELITGWSAIESAATKEAGPRQKELFDE
jgi:putative DNA methylase